MKNIRRLFQKAKKTPGGSTTQKYAPAENTPQLGFSNVPAEWQGLRENHYKKWFGDSKDIMIWHEIVPTIPHIDIHVFPPSKELGRNFYTLVTSGMSDEKMTLPKGIDKQFARAELVFYVADGGTKTDQTTKPWYVQAMSFYAHFPFNYKTWLAFSHTIPNGNPPAPVVEGSLLTTAFLVPAFYEPKEFIIDLRLGDERVNFYWLTFLSDKETDYKLKHGYEKLMNKLNEDNFPRVFDPLRRSII